MSSELLVTIFLVAIALATVLLVIRRYPVRILRRWLQCPAYNYLTRVGFLRRETGFGNFVLSDVSECSLFGKEPVTCDKDCLRSNH